MSIATNTNIPTNGKKLVGEGCEKLERKLYARCKAIGITVVTAFEPDIGFVIALHYTDKSGDVWKPHELSYGPYPTKVEAVRDAMTVFEKAGVVLKAWKTAEKLMQEDGE